MNVQQRDAENIRQLRIDGENEIAKLEQRIASVRTKLTEIAAIEQGLTTALPVHFMAVIDLRNDILVFDTIKKTVEELRKSERVKSIKLVINQVAFIKYENELGALAFVREASLEFLYSGAYVLDHHPGTLDMGTF